MLICCITPRLLCRLSPPPLPGCLLPPPRLSIYCHYFPLYCHQTTHFYLPDGRTASPYYHYCRAVFGWLLCVFSSNGGRPSNNFIPSHNKFVASFQSMRIHPQFALIPARSFVVVIVVIHRFCCPSPTPI